MLNTPVIKDPWCTGGACTPRLVCVRLFARGGGGGEQTHHSSVLVDEQVTVDHLQGNARAEREHGEEKREGMRARQGLAQFRAMDVAWRSVCMCSVARGKGARIVS